MKRFLLFAGEEFYPSGGWSDLVDSFATIEEAKLATVPFNDKYQWSHIVDMETWKIVWPI